MIPPTASHHDPAIIAVEGGLTAIAIAVVFSWPQLGSRYFSRMERFFAQLARRKTLSVALVGISAFLLRLAVLPLCPIPQPFVHDDFSYLLAADTYASGRLTNPTPAMWTHFETFHVIMKPTYMSMYFPAQGLVLAAGKALTGQAWFGLLCVTALMCAAICWMLQAWLPPGWALLGGVLAVLRIGLFSYWIDTYVGGGSIAALGGALVLGALPRLMRTVRLRYSVTLAIGIILLAFDRPYEGLLLCLPVAFVLGRWILHGKNTPPASLLFQRATLPVLLIIAAGAWMGYYNYRVFGSSLTPPYKIGRATYAIAPYWIWQPLRPKPVYRHKIMEEFFCHEEVSAYQSIHSLTGFLPQTLIKAVRTVLFFAGILLLPLLVMLPRAFLDRRIRFLVACVLVLACGQIIEVFFFPHYIAPFTAALYALGLQAMRHLRQCKPGNQPVGLALVRLTIALCFVMAAVRVCAAPLHVSLGTWPSGDWSVAWYGPGQFGAPRARIEAALEHLPGQQLAIVRYAPGHDALDAWVANAADIDRSKVIWANEMGPADNLDLIRYYSNRTVWLIQPDAKPGFVISPYPVSAQESAGVK